MGVEGRFGVGFVRVGGEGWGGMGWDGGVCARGEERIDIRIKETPEGGEWRWGEWRLVVVVLLLGRRG